LLPEHVDRIYGWYGDYKTVEAQARVVTLEEIAANDHSLNIPRYVEPRNEKKSLGVEEAKQQLLSAAKAASAAEDRLIVILKKKGLLR
jgi:type I restriction enzyme M protein